MQLYFLYLGKTVLISGLLVGYYFLFLRNRKFNQYNRIYLITAVIIPWVIPLFKIEFTTVPSRPASLIQVLRAINTGNNTPLVTENINSVLPQSEASWNTIALYFFIVISAVCLIRLIAATVQIFRLIKTERKESFDNAILILTDVKGTPFSFFKYIFWNEKIDRSTKEGSQILLHELAHVKERHSIDKVLINLILVVGWFNPFIWLLRRELNIVHEFIADQKAILAGDSSALASMLLHVSFPETSSILASSFFHSSIKRRLIMISNLKRTRFSYMRKLSILPMFFLLIIIFSFAEVRKPVKETSHTFSSSLGKNEKAENKKFSLVPFEKKLAHGEESLVKLGNNTGAVDTSFIDETIDGAIEKYVTKDETIGNIPDRLKLVWPVDNATISLHFGPYTLSGEAGNVKGLSDGLYFSTQLRAPVKAALEGTVTSVFDLGNEKVVTVNHGDYFTTYGNLSSEAIIRGQKVRTGELLGYTGANQAGVGQLLFMLSDKAGKLLNPENFMVK